MSLPRLRSVQRLTAAFAVILVFFALALVVVLRALGAMAAADAEMLRVGKAKDASQRVAVLAREQYIHQAHTLIEGNDSHLDHYAKVADLTRRAADDLEPLAASDEERALARSIAALVRRSDSEFMTVTLPVMHRDDRAQMRELHRAMDAVVAQTARETKQLTASFTRRSEAAAQTATDVRAHTRTTVVIFFTLATSFAAAIAYFATRSLGKRLAELQRGMARIGSGDLGARVVADGSDEFTALAHDINQMAAALAHREEELLSAQRLAAIGQVAAGVAHEINNPLGVVLGYAKMMRRAGTSGDDEGLRIIEEEALECQRIVQALLDLARPQPLSIKAIDLKAVVRDTIERLRATGVLQSAVVEQFEKSQEDVHARADETKVRQVFRNLLTNAAEAAGADGEISIEVLREDGRAVLAIEDTGPGIPEGDRSRVCEPFFTTKAKGTGLGLAIVHAIVEAHHGTVRLECQPGRGTRVVVSLPEASTGSERP